MLKMLDGLRVLMVRHRIPAHIINRVSAVYIYLYEKKENA